MSSVTAPLPRTGPPSTRQATWGIIAALLRPRRRLLGLVAASLLVAKALDLVPPLIIQHVLDDALTPRRPAPLLPLGLLYLAATVASQALTFGAVYLTAVAAQGALHDLRVRLICHLQGLPLHYYDQTPLGDIISRCTADVETVDTLFSTGVISLVANLARLVLAAGAMLLLSPVLTLVVALVLPPLVLITRYFQVRVRNATRRTRAAIGLLNSQIQETLGGVEVIRAFGRADFFSARFRGALRAALRVTNRAARFSALYSPLMAVLAATTTALLLAVGAGGSAAWGVSLGTLTAFVLLFGRFFEPITSLGDDWQTVQSALSGLERIFQVLALPAEARPAVQAPRVPAPRVEIQNLVFGYRPERPVLHGITVHIRAGEHVALVGRTGAGKSSLLHLLGGLYAPWAGTVRVDGRDPRTLAEEERRRVLGVVPQTVQLFSGTVWENLTLGDAAVPQAMVERAAEIAGAAAFIQALPRGYATILGASGGRSGVELSAGQRQLLALARALVWDPGVLLLDEATAAIDSASEAAFWTALRAEVSEQGRAVLTVAHRLATARTADRVLVLDGGHIVEAGAPETLLRQGGRFAALAELEAAGWDWHDGPTPI